MLKILIADDHEIVRRGIKQILLEEFSFVQIEEADDTGSLVEKALNDDWDIIISDMAMPGGGGLTALKVIKEKAPAIPVLFFSTYSEEQYALRVIKAGANGYLNKETATDELCKAVKQVLAGRIYVSPAIAETLGLSLIEKTPTLPHELLSPRELNIFIMLASGKSVIEIATTLSLASTTISTYRSRILTKLNLKTNADLTLYALEHKFI
ncbi:MAG: response regulator transcription factor [Bacteroidota bacterium]